jgi:hypothetical protein
MEVTESMNNCKTHIMQNYLILNSHLHQQLRSMEVASHAVLNVVQIISVYFLPYGNIKSFPYLCHQNSVGHQFTITEANYPTPKCDGVLTDNDCCRMGPSILFYICSDLTWKSDTTSTEMAQLQNLVHPPFIMCLLHLLVSIHVINSPFEPVQCYILTMTYLL